MSSPGLPNSRTPMFPEIPKGEIISTYDRYEDAKHAVDRWPVGKPPAELVRIAALYDLLLQSEREKNGQGEFRQFDKNGNPNRKFIRLPRDKRTVMMAFNKEFLKVAGKRAE